MNIPEVITRIGLNMTHGPWLAGGAARRLYHNNPVMDADWDIFFSSRLQYSKALHRANMYGLEVEGNYKRSMVDGDTLVFPQVDSKYATTMILEGHKIQFIHKKFYDNADELLDDFDFSVCKYATDGRDFVKGYHTLADEREKILRYEKKHIQQTLISRIIKYRVYGYRVSKELATLMHDNLPLIDFSLSMDVYDF